MTDTAPQSNSTDRRRKWSAILTTAISATLAGVVWLTVAGNLAATGTRIADLESKREALTERRARALVAHAGATDPRRLEVRAAELGFRPPEAVSFVPVTYPIGHPASSEAVRSESPLGVFLARDGKSVPRVAVGAPEVGGVLVSSDHASTTSLAMAPGSAAP